LKPETRNEKPLLDSSPLRRTATVVRNRRCVFNVTNFDSCRSQGADRRFAPGTRATDAHFDAAHTVIASHAGGVLGGLLGGKRRPFARSAKTQRPGTLPSQHVAGLVRDCDNCVVERGLNVGYAVRNVLPLLLLEGFFLALFVRRCWRSGPCCRWCWCCWFCHNLVQSSVVSHSQFRLARLLTTADRRLPSKSWPSPSSSAPPCPCVGPCGYVRWYGCVVRGPAGSGGDDSRGRNQFR